MNFDNMKMPKIIAAAVVVIAMFLPFIVIDGGDLGSMSFNGMKIITDGEGIGKILCALAVLGAVATVVMAVLDKDTKIAALVTGGSALLCGFLSYNQAKGSVPDGMADALKMGFGVYVCAAAGGAVIAFTLKDKAGASVRASQSVRAIQLRRIKIIFSLAVGINFFWRQWISDQMAKAMNQDASERFVGWLEDGTIYDVTMGINILFSVSLIWAIQSLCSNCIVNTEVIDRTLSQANTVPAAAVEP